jgi:hypothetical protein
VTGSGGTGTELPVHWPGRDSPADPAGIIGRVTDVTIYHMVYTIWYIPDGIYHDIYHGIHHSKVMYSMIYTMVYTIP